MTHTDFGVTGAKRTSVEENNPMAMLMELCEKYPQASESELLRRFTDETLGDPDMNKVVIGYTFANLRKRMCESPRKLRDHGRAVLRRAALDRETDRMRSGLQKVIKEKAQEMLMDMTMPNGRRLADCTIAYVGRLGGWLSRIAEGKNPRQTVGHVYDEEQLRELRRAR